MALDATITGAPLAYSSPPWTADPSAALPVRAICEVCTGRRRRTVHHRFLVRQHMAHRGEQRRPFRTAFHIRRECALTCSHDGSREALGEDRCDTTAHPRRR